MVFDISFDPATSARIIDIFCQVLNRVPRPYPAGGCMTRGTLSCTVVPCIGVLVTLNCPCISLMMRDDIDSPSPVPFPYSLVVKKGWRI